MARMKRKIEPTNADELEVERVDADTPITNGQVDLGAALSRNDKESIVGFDQWLVGKTPLICHAWSHKAKLEMLEKQTGATKLAKDKRSPDDDFLNSLYQMGDVGYGFPVTAVKSAIIANAHIKRGIAKVDVMAALWLDCEMWETRPALAGARCDMPLVRIWGSKPEMREDMVRVGAGLRKTANFAYRAQFTTWAIRISGKLNTNVVAPHALAFLFRQAGQATGIGDWGNEKGGVFGAFAISNPEETAAWDNFAAGKGPLPASAFKINRISKKAA